MTHALALAGWLVAAVASGAALLTRSRLIGHIDVVRRACHELRAPLTAARLGIELGFRGEHLSEARLRAIELELGRATLALQDLSDAPRARGSAREGTVRSDHDREEVDVAALLADSVEAWRAAAVARAVGLRLVAGRGRPYVSGERLRLAQATGNLIVNAIEHGGRAVEVSFRSDRERVRIEVVDDGPGLPGPVEELARRRRRRPKVARRVDCGGRGHGLAIASAIAAAHGGRLAAAPSERGATLVLELPATRAE